MNFDCLQHLEIKKILFKIFRIAPTQSKPRFHNATRSIIFNADYQKDKEYLKKFLN